MLKILPLQSTKGCQRRKRNKVNSTMLLRDIFKINEEGGATAGGTAAANVSIGAVHGSYEDNKKMAKGKRKNGAPQAPRVKPTDNGLNADNLITGGSIKRR